MLSFNHQPSLGDYDPAPKNSAEKDEAFLDGIRPVSSASTEYLDAFLAADRMSEINGYPTDIQFNLGRTATRDSDQPYGTFNETDL